MRRGRRRRHYFSFQPPHLPPPPFIFVWSESAVITAIITTTTTIIIIAAATIIIEIPPQALPVIFTLPLPQRRLQSVIHDCLRIRMSPVSLIFRLVSLPPPPSSSSPSFFSPVFVVVALKALPMLRGPAVYSS